MSAMKTLAKLRLTIGTSQKKPASSQAVAVNRSGAMSVRVKAAWADSIVDFRGNLMKAGRVGNDRRIADYRENLAMESVSIFSNP